MDGDKTTSLRISGSIVSSEAILKTCYWFSRDFFCDVQDEGTGYAIVVLRPKRPLVSSLEEAKEAFTAQALDFAWCASSTNRH